MKYNLKKLGNIIYSAINEAFDFNEVDNEEPDIISLTTIREAAIKRMYDISPKYVMLNLGMLNIYAYSASTIVATDFKNNKCSAYFKTNDTKMQISTYFHINNTFALHLIKTLELNHWNKFTFFDAYNQLELKNTLDFYVNNIKKGYQINLELYDTIQEKMEAAENCLDIFVSPDNGIICVKSHYNQLCLFMFTGNIVYTKNKELTKFEIDDKVYKWFCNLLKLYGVSASHSNYKLIYDKNEYPRLAAIITHKHLWKSLPEATYKSSIEDGWDTAIKTNNPNVLLRRNTADGMFEYGIFFPWNPFLFFNSEINSAYKQTYTLEYVDKVTMDEVKKKPDNYGLVVFQLGKKGKKAFDKYKQNNYRNIKEEDGEEINI